MVPYQTHTSPVLSARLLTNDEKTGAMAIEDGGRTGEDDSDGWMNGWTEVGGRMSEKATRYPKERFLQPLAVEVRFEDRTDYIISTQDQEMRTYGPVKAAGRFAVVSVDHEGRVMRAYLLAGTSLECGETRMSLPRPSTRLKVKSVSNRTFHLSDPLPPNLVQKGDYLLASGPEPLEKGLPRPQTGFEIASVTKDSITVRDYPVVECDEITVLHSTSDVRCPMSDQ